jgi:ABC-type multidrug transport system fused ATPase/permease subunit
VVCREAWSAVVVVVSEESRCVLRMTSQRDRHQGWCPRQLPTRAPTAVVLSGGLVMSGVGGHDGVRAVDLCRSFGEEQAVDRLDLGVEAGQIHALVGLNGAGKTTLIRLLLGMLRPDRGSVTIFGVPVGDAPASLWDRVGHLLDTGFGYPELSAAENLRSAAYHLILVPVTGAAGVVATLWWWQIMEVA